MSITTLTMDEEAARCIIGALTGSPYPLTATEIASNIPGWTKKKVNQHIYKMGRTVEQIPGTQPPKWKLIDEATIPTPPQVDQTQQEGATGTSTPPITTPTQAEDIKQEVIRYLQTQSSPVSAPDVSRFISSKLKCDTATIKRILYELQTKAVVINVSSKEQKPLWEMKSAKPPKTLNGKPLYAKEEDENGHGVMKLIPVDHLNDAEYAKAMAEGAGDLEHLNIVLHGPPGSGKSSFKRAILGEDPLPKEEQNSTDIIENAVRAVSIDRMKRFEVMSSEDIVKLLAQSLVSCMMKEAASSEQQKSTAVDDIPLSFVNPDKSASSVLADMIDMCKLQNIEPSLELFKSRWHHLIDSGGQIQFQDLFPLVYNGCSFQFVLMRLTDGLDKKIRNCYIEKGKNVLENQQCDLAELTNRQYIEEICQIAASTSPKSQVMIVGTHKDKLGNEAETIAKIEEVNIGLREIYEKYDDVLIRKSWPNEIIFDINAMATGKEREKIAEEFQEEIGKVFQKLKDTTLGVPLRWLAFQLDISDDDSNPVKKIEDCCEIGKDNLGMDETAVKSALNYFKRAALLLYYPDYITEIVLTKVDPLVSKLSQLVKASFIPPPELLRNAEYACKKLRSTGIFNQSFLDDVFDKRVATSLSNDLFLKMLLCLKIAHYIGKADDGNADDPQYFLPSALSSNFSCTTFENSCNPAGFSWSKRVLPHGFFFTVAIEFLATCFGDCVFELCSSSKLTQCRKEIIFQQKSNNIIPGMLKLTNQITWIQVSTNTRKFQCCPVIFKSVEIAIHKAINQHFKHLRPPTRVSLCPKCPNSDHYCTLTDDNDYFTCSNDGGVKPVTHDMLYWWTEKNQPTILLDTNDKSCIKVDNRILSSQGLD